ncbi:MAG: tetratricopeptide repeat protein [Terriglobales bacterium]
MRKNLVALMVVLALGAVTFTPQALAEDKGIIQLQKTVDLLLGQVQDLQKSLTLQMGAVQGLVQQNTDTVNKLSTTLASIEHDLSGNRDVAAQRQTDMSQQFQSISDAIGDLKQRLTSINETLQQVHQLQQTIPAPGQGPAGANAAGATPAGSAAGATPPVGANASDAAGVNAATNGSTSAPVVSPAAAQYQAALNDFQSDKATAQSELASFIRAYPNDPQTPDAMYYLGTVFMQKEQYNEAIDSFNQVIVQYPDNAQAPNAEFNKGISLLKQGNRVAALSELKALVKNYPSSEARRRADMELKSLAPHKK